jgi:type 1 glutamine amidotransferase
MKSKRRLVLIGCLVALVGALLPAAAASAAAPEYRVFVFTGGAANQDVKDAVKSIRDIGKERGFQVVANGDAEQFTEESLARFRAVVFLNTSGDVLNGDQQAAFEAYFSNGGGFLGIGSAVETEPEWQFLTDILGTRAVDAVDAQAATVEVADQVHPAGEGLPDYWGWTDAFYNFDANVRGESHVIATVDENTYSGGSMGFDHPVVWCKDYQGGRSFYSSLGGNQAAFGDADFMGLFTGALEWAAGVGEGDCGATVWANYEMSFIARPPNIGEPIEFTVFPDGRVLNTSRTGDVWLHAADGSSSEVIASLDVYSHSEDGLYGGEVDPNFEENGWVYLFYAPPTVEDIVLSDGSVVTQTTPPGNAPQTSLDPTAWDPYFGYFQLSRFRFVDGADPYLDLDSEQQIMRVFVNRGTCCHVAGEIRFDSQGNLWIVTGDDTNAGGSGGFTPINDRGAPGELYQNPAYDARRSAGNTNDLRGPEGIFLFATEARS